MKTMTRGAGWRVYWRLIFFEGHLLKALIMSRRWNGTVSRVKPQTSAASSLRKLISGRSMVVAPGVFSPIVAQLAEKVGFKAIYFSGGGFANLLGMPDLGVTTLAEVSEAARRIVY